jgi:hypothetical protein
VLVFRHRAHTGTQPALLIETGPVEVHPIMPLMDDVQKAMADAMRQKASARLSTLRMLKAALMEEKTKKPRDAGLTADEEIAVVQRYAKKRRETIEDLQKHGQDEALVAREEEEIAVTRRYLPEALDEAALRELVRQAIAATGAAGPRDMGKVIGAVMAQVKGRAEGGDVSRLVKELLAG